MENAQLVGLSRQVSLQRQMDMVANNLANINTNGYKSQSLLFEEYMMPLARDNSFQPVDRPLSFVVDDANLYDLQPGNMLETGSQLDVAIDGSGWFAVQTPNGERYTRNGSFAVNSQGQFVTRDGNPVLTDAGPLTLAPSESTISIAADGTISTNQGARGKLRVVDFDKPGNLKKIGDTLFEGTNPQTARLPRLMQGQLEKSNVRGVVELSRMVEVSRNYSAVAQWVQNTDELRRTAIEKLGQVS